VRTDIPIDTVNPLFVPKPGVNYTNAGAEEIVTQFPTPSSRS
jgi:hypothetical protein